MKYVKGFTVAELVVSMLLTAVLVTSVYSAYRYTSKTYEIFSRDSDDISDVYRLMGQIEDIFWCNDSVKICQGNAEIYRNDTIKGEIKTDGESLFFKRNDEFRDTLTGEYIEINGFQDSNPVNCGKAAHCQIKIVIKGDSLSWVF